MADDKYSVSFEVDTTKAVKSIGDVERAASKTAQTFERGWAPATNKVESATNKAAEAAKKSAEQFNRNLAAAAALGGAFASLSSQLGPVGQALGAAASGAGALYAAMGPMGAVIGGIAGALPALINAIDQTSDSSARATNNLTNLQNTVVSLADEVARASDEYRRFFAAVQGSAGVQDTSRLLAGAREGAIRQADRVRELQGRLDDFGTLIEVAGGGAGGGVVAAIRAEIQLAEREQRRFESEVTRLEGGLRTAVARAEEERRAAEAEADAQSIRAKAAARANRGPGRDRTAELEKEKNAAIRLFQEEAAVAQQLVDKEWERLEAVKQIAEQEARTLAAIEESLALKNKLAQDERDQREWAREVEQAEGEKNKAMIAFQQEQADEQERYNKVVQRSQAGMEGVLDIANRTAQLQRETNASFGEAFKTAVDEWLKGFALQSAYKGVAATAEAIGSAVTNQPNTAAKLAEAGMHFALAAAAGGASAAIPNAGGGGGGGRAARPEAVGSGGGGSGGGTIVINYNAPTTEAERGRMAQRDERARSRRFG